MNHSRGEVQKQAELESELRHARAELSQARASIEMSTGQVSTADMQRKQAEARAERAEKAAEAVLSQEIADQRYKPHPVPNLRMSRGDLVKG